MKIEEFSAKDFCKNAVETLKDRKVIEWIALGMLVYGLSAIYRYATRNPMIGLPLIEPPNQLIPPNLIEKIIVNFIAPGGVGAAIGETFAQKYNENLSWGQRHLSRIAGSFVAAGIWTGVQYFGYNLSNIFNYQWPSGGNPFEPPNIYIFNMIVALTLAPFAPYLIERFFNFSIYPIINKFLRY